MKKGKQKDYWHNKLGGELPVLDLPLDYPRPAVKSYEGATVMFTLTKEEAKNIKLFTEKEGLTLYMALLSMFNLLLAKLSGQEDIIVGTPIAAQDHANLQGIAGVFVNTLVMRNFPYADMPVKKFLSELKNNTLEAFENQDHQLEVLVDKIPVAHDISRNPVLDVMFCLLGQSGYEGASPRIDAQGPAHEKGTSKFDLTLLAIEQGEQLLLGFEYCTSLFKAETIERYIKYFKQIIGQLPGGGKKKISEIEIIDAEGKHQLLHEFNDTKSEYPKDRTIHSLFEEQYQRSPDSIAVYCGEEKITYQDLNSRSNKLAFCLASKGYNKQIVGIVAERKIEVIIGILGILKSGNAYLPLDPLHPRERNKKVLDESGAKVVITNIPGMDIGKVEIVFLNNKELYQQEYKKCSCEVKSTDLAYIIYTSGSTGIPKGVMVEHGNVVNFVYGMKAIVPTKANESLLSLTTISFDIFGMELYVPLLNGTTMSLADSQHQYDMQKLLDIVEKTNVTAMQLTPSRLKIFLDNPISKQIFKKVQTLLVGGEEFPAALHKQVTEATNCDIFNMYGPTETTIWSTYKNVTGSNTLNIGKPIINTHVYILGPRLELRPIGVVGGLYISGAGVSRGYYKNETLTKECFIDNPFNSGTKLYRTGDLARWLPDGNIEFMGRADCQVKIRGFRIELGEIENALLKHEEINECVVVDREDKGEKYLCAYIVIDNNKNDLGLREYLSKSLPDYMIPQYFVILNKLPLTPNGKIDRKALPSPEVKAGEDYLAPSNETEAKLTEIWSEVLNIPQEEISVMANFFTIGGHSLKATLLRGKIHKCFGVELAVSDLFLHYSIRGQSQQIKQGDAKNFMPIPKAKEREYYPLSSAQKRMYLIQQADIDSVAYNEPLVFTLKQDACKYRIKEIFEKIISRHESLRTAFETIDGVPVQRIYPKVDFNITEQKILETEIEKKRAEFIRPFDLSRPPLLRFELLHVVSGNPILLIDMHHIIIDGVSHSIIEKEFKSLYSGEELQELLLQYRDYSEWQNSLEQQRKVKFQENFWINKFSGELPVLDLPLDYSRPPVQSYEGATVKFDLRKEETTNIKLLAEAEGMTLYMILLSVLNILLTKLSGQEDIIVGIPVAGRDHADLENIVGMFVNTLAIRNEVKDDIALKEFFTQVKKTTIEAFENQDYQFEDLVEKVSVEWDTGRNPIFDVMFNLLDQEWYGGSLPGCWSKEYRHINGASKFDLTLTAMDYGEQLALSFEYSTKLFSPQTIERFIVYLGQIIKQLPDNLNKKILEIEILTEEEKHQVLYGFNSTKRDYPQGKTISILFREQSTRFKDEVAIKHRDGLLTYNELMEASCLLSGVLQGRGVLPGDVVAIEQYRSVEMVASIFGILQAGCTYLPVDPAYPESRKTYMLSASNAKYVLTTREIDFPERLPIEKIFVDGLFPLRKSGVIEQAPIPHVGSAYIIYTSGSTGNPKGVLVGHGSVTNLLYSLQEAYPVGRRDTYLFKTSSCFDVSVIELFGWILGGGSMAILEKFFEKDPESILKAIEDHKVTHVNFVPSMFKLFSDMIYEENKAQLKPLKYVFLAGEALTYGHIQSFLMLGLPAKIENLYGPTESTVYASMSPVGIEDDGQPISIGKGIMNTELYIINKALGVQPIGVPGELCIGGSSLAKGYLNNPVLTCEKFIGNPFSPDTKIYRTGDLARWLPDGNIEFLGRIDHQVKIRGFRVELGEIESVLLKHENISECVVLAREDEEEKYLCAYIVIKNEGLRIKDENELGLREYLSNNMPEYMVPQYFVVLENLPLNANGKLNRKTLPSPEIKAGKDYVAPSNETEEKLVKIWSEILNIQKEEISVTASFFVLGGHSLNAIKLVSLLHKSFNIKISYSNIFTLKTIKEISEFLRQNIERKGKYDSLKSIEKKDYYFLSSAQKRMFILQDTNNKNVGYNIFFAYNLVGEINNTKLENIFKDLILRHESLRTSFTIVDDIPVQKVWDNVDLSIEYFSKTGDMNIRDFTLDTKTIKSFIRPFDLSRAPLFRIGIVENEGNKVLLIDMHHIISDDRSIRILAEEFERLYIGGELRPLEFQYRDYAECLNKGVMNNFLSRQEGFWLNKLKNNLTSLELPLDFRRPEIQSFDGMDVQFTINNLYEGVKNILKVVDGTSFMVFFALLNSFLYKITGQEDMVIGVPVAGRANDSLENILGMFVNTLPLRNKLSGDQTFRELLFEVKEVVVQGIENQEYPFDELVNKLGIKRGSGKTPVFNVLFNFLKDDSVHKDYLTINDNEYVHRSGIAKYDLTFTVYETADSFFLTFAYCSKIFKPETINKLIDIFKETVSSVMINMDIKLSDILVSDNYSSVSTGALQFEDGDFNF